MNKIFMNGILAGLWFRRASAPRLVPGCLALLLFLAAAPVLAASDSLMNAPSQAGGPLYGPGALVLLPDGRKVIIEEALPQGGWRTEEGIIINPQGVLEKGGQAVPLDPATLEPIYRVGMEVVLPDGRKTTIVEVLPNGDLRTEAGVVLTPKGEIRSTAPQKPDPGKQKAEAVKPPEKAPAKTAPPSPEENPLSLAEMLPLTRVPGKGDAPAPKVEEPARQKPKAEQKVEEPARQKPKAEQKVEKPAPQKPKAEPARPEAAKKTPKTPVGQELKIPPEAAKTGNLDFLEGCWQGTRPEYTSKRTIRECFCFGPNGGNGKRRVIDPRYNRMCIGASRASLSKDGTLSVTSESAACTDGERWGSAEMVCRNTGPRTPCSWVFMDANNGRQSYQIPFVRVESCGR